jgi:hypothetical protein
MEDQFIFPSKRSRVVALLKVGGRLAAVYILYLAALAYMHARYVWLHVPCELVTSTQIVVVAAAVVLAALSVAAGYAAWRVWRSGQVPAPGTAMLFKRAVYAGWWQRVYTASMVIAVVVFISLLAQLLGFFVFASGGPHLFSIHACAA